MLINQLLQYLPQHPLLHSLSILAILAVLSLLAFWITEKVIISLLSRLFRKTSTQLDDILINHKIFNRLAFVVPALIFYNFAYSAPQFTIMIQRASLTLIALSCLLVFNAFLSAMGDIYEKTKYSERMNIKSYIQITKLIINILGLVIMAAVLIGKNPTWLLSGLGAFAAVLILIFKDTILTIVAN